jgi:hypothetical protein
VPAPTPPQFACSHCGKQYTWKPALAGKRAKCACGETLTVPDAPGGDDDPYDFAEPPPPPKRTAAPPILQTPATPVATAGGAPALGYATGRTSDDEDRGRTQFDAFYHKPRDFYWPAGVLLVGYVALMAWAVTSGASGGGLVLFSAYITVATLIKTAVMIGAAFVIAPMAGVSFGTFWTAVLKLAALVVVTDAALFWFQDIMEATGAYPSGGGGRRSWLAVGLVNTLLAGTIIALLLKVFFDMDREDVGTLAVPLAILNRVLNFLLVLVLLGIVSALRSAAAGPGGAGAGGAGAAAAAAVAPPGSAPATRTTAPAPPTPANAAVAAKDAEIAALIANKGLVRDAVDHYVGSVSKRADRNLDFVRSLQYAGASRVYVRIAVAEGRVAPSHVIVELPPDAPQRGGIVLRLRQFAVEHKLPLDPQTIQDQGDWYLIVPMPTGR